MHNIQLLYDRFNKAEKTVAALQSHELLPYTVCSDRKTISELQLCYIWPQILADRGNCKTDKHIRSDVGDKDHGKMNLISVHRTCCPDDLRVLRHISRPHSARPLSTCADVQKARFFHSLGRARRANLNKHFFPVFNTTRSIMWSLNVFRRECEKNWRFSYDFNKNMQKISTTTPHSGMGFSWSLQVGCVVGVKERKYCAQLSWRRKNHLPVAASE